MAGQPPSSAATAGSSTASTAAGSTNNTFGAISIGAGFLSAIGNLYAGQSTANSLEAQANLQLQNAQEAEAQGKFNALKSQIASNLKIGTITSNYGASGVSQNSSSAQAVLAASTSNAELDRLNILHGADVKAINYENQAAMDKIGAQSALTGSYFQAAGSVIGGASRSLASTIGVQKQSIGPGGVLGPQDLTGSSELQNPGLGSQFNKSSYATDTLPGAQQYMYDMPSVDGGGNYLDSAHGWITMDQSDIGI